MLRGSRLGRLVSLAALSLMLASSPAAAGDRITELTSMLSSSSEKTRLSAVLSLARLHDKRAMKPLVTALQDPNAQVRAVAATALSKLGHKAALPALKTAATDDTDETVRKAARDAYAAIAKANHVENDLATPATDATAATPTSPPVQARKTGFGRSPKAVEDRPDLYVTVKAANDDSPGVADKASRKANAEALMASLKEQLGKARQVTMLPDEAARWGLDNRSIDVSVVKLEVTQSTGYMEIAAELRLAISDNQGKMLSFLSGGAKVQVPLKKYKPQFLPNMKKEALDGAMRGMFDKLLVHLRQITTT